MSQFAFEIDDFIQHRSEREFTFPLFASSIGRRTTFRVKARRLSIMDRASLGFLPDHLQNEVWKQLKAASRELQKMQDAGAEPKDIHEALANNDANLRVANIFCIYGIIEPTFVADKRDEDPSQRKLHVEWIAPEDRIAFMIACNDADSEQARHFATFREERTDAVPNRQGGEVLGDTPIRIAGHGHGNNEFVPPVQR